MSTQDNNTPSIAPDELIKLLSTLPGPLVKTGEEFNAIGFVDHNSGVTISNPAQSSCGRFEVDPQQTYGVSEAQTQALKLVNETVYKAVDAAINDMFHKVQTLLGVTDGGLAAQYASASELAEHLHEHLAVYAMAEIRFAS